MDKKEIKRAAIELEKMIEKYINDYPEVEWIKYNFCDLIDMAKREHIGSPLLDLPTNPYLFTETRLGHIQELESAYSKFTTLISLDTESYDYFMSMIRDIRLKRIQEESDDK
ncbi:hypothetical protein [Pasteurella atlantica]|uniref:hypothetical protein n=1 Tax=Pasteurellaceae TaxID=712 RepID=UPI002754E822|nr:hypothetical protein [Pasteurella atlantica]MDP8099879.1 hypothetical protein [Pasteurella atlantica]MDP8107725.1 hypothetical protein [Pasteurella atlantica]MDP8117506.1 hypothetical protein [Pasteurella atlantica]